MSEAVTYETDDRDFERRNYLEIVYGENGDFYVAVAPVGEKTAGRAIRVCMSGGASQHNPAFANAIARAYWALRERPIDSLDAARAEGYAAGVAEELSRQGMSRLEWRGVETPCATCGGSGVRPYASTATWMRGPGGQEMTIDVCDSCWGSGDAHRHGVDLRALKARIDGAKAAGVAEATRKIVARLRAKSQSYAASSQKIGGDIGLDCAANALETEADGIEREVKT